MSLDSRLFRPMRSNSSSASSALVSVGVSSVGRPRRGRVVGMSGRSSMVGVIADFRRAGARRRARSQRCDDGGDGRVDLLVGQRARRRRQQLQAHRQAALAGADVGGVAPVGLVDVEQRRVAHQAASRRRVDRGHQRVVRDVVAATTIAMSRHADCCLRQRRRSSAASRAMHAPRASISNTTGACGSSYAWRQRGWSSPTQPMRLAVELDRARSGPDAAPDARRRRSARRAARAAPRRRP